MGKSEFVDYLLELIAPLGNVSARRMFGGYGIYVDSQIIGLVIRDILYFKTDEGNRPAFLELGLEPFSFAARGKTVAIAYFRAPDEAMDSPHAMLPWARGALAAALRVAAAKTTAKKRAPTGATAAKRAPSKVPLNPTGKKSRKR